MALKPLTVTAAVNHGLGSERKVQALINRSEHEVVTSNLQLHAART